MARAVLAGMCSAVLALGPCLPVAHAAEQTSADVRRQAAAENERLKELVGQLDATRGEVSALDSQIKDLAQQSIVVQGELIEDRAQLKDMVATSYRWGDSPSLWDIALSSESIDDFVSKLYYANKVTEWQTNCVVKLEDDKRGLEEHMNQIEEVRNDRREAVRELEDTCTELSESVNSLLEYASGLEAQERAAEEARLAEIARMAALEQQRAQQQRVQDSGAAEARELAQTAATNSELLEASAEADEAAAAKAKAEATVVESADDLVKVDTTDVATGETDAEAAAAATPETPVVDQPAPVEEPEVVPEPTVAEQIATAQPEASDDGGDWVNCIASAYTIEDNYPAGSTATASGIPLDNSVPTVALPISMDPERFYGSMVQIEYDGMSVVAMVTDCGGMGGGSRGLDLTPAVFEAFGAETGDDWGLRDVRYRFL